MSKIIGRKPVEIKISAQQNESIPIYNIQYGGWDTINKNDLVTLPPGLISSSQQVIDIFNANFTSGSSMVSTVDSQFATDAELYVTASNLDAGEF